MYGVGAGCARDAAQVSMSIRWVTMRDDAIHDNKQDPRRLMTW